MEIKQKLRNSNLEILRIIAMFFIVADHWAWCGFDEVNFVVSNVNTFFIYFPIIFGQVGVDIFILISAYFMINSKFTFRKLMLLGGEVYFYSILFLILFLTILTPIQPVDFHNLIYSIFPICLGQYWFITHYIVLMLISPFLNKFIKSLSKKEFSRLILVVVIIWCLLPTFTFLNDICNRMTLFIVLYFIGSYIRLYLNIDKVNSRKLFIVFIISILIIYSLYVSTSIFYLKTNLEVFSILSKIVANGNCIFVLMASFSLFLIFLKREEFSNSFINFISNSVLGVYLIHNNIFVSPYIWKGLLNNPSHYFSPNLIIFALISIFTVYIVCTLIDIIRRLTIEKIWIIIVDNKLINIPQFIISKFKIVITYLTGLLA